MAVLVRVRMGGRIYMRVPVFQFARLVSCVSLVAHPRMRVHMAPAHLCRRGMFPDDNDDAIKNVCESANSIQHAVELFMQQRHTHNKDRVNVAPPTANVNWKPTPSPRRPRTGSASSAQHGAGTSAATHNGVDDHVDDLRSRVLERLGEHGMHDLRPGDLASVGTGAYDSVLFVGRDRNSLTQDQSTLVEGMSTLVDTVEARATDRAPIHGWMDATTVDTTASDDSFVNCPPPPTSVLQQHPTPRVPSSPASTHARANTNTSTSTPPRRTPPPPLHTAASNNAHHASGSSSAPAPRTSLSLTTPNRTAPNTHPRMDDTDSDTDSDEFTGFGDLPMHHAGPPSLSRGAGSAVPPTHAELRKASLSFNRRLWPVCVPLSLYGTQPALYRPNHPRVWQ